MESWIDVNGSACRYALSGDGPSAIVLVHELGGSLNSWDGLLPLLPPARVLRYDMRGCGMSEKLRGSAEIDVLCDDIAALADALGIGAPLCVIGAAVGGAIAIRFATRHAGRCARLVLLAPALRVPPERRAAALEMADRLDRDGMRSLRGTVLPKAFPEALWTSTADRDRAYARWLGADPHGYAAAYRMLAGVDMRADLPQVGCPVLVVAGRLDPFGPPDLIEPAVRDVPDLRFVAVNAGHFMAVQTPAVVAAAIGAFVSA
ncbi:MAG: alpha/beta fold hydrolase [Rhodospirillales bacterium]|nr:alpha/beta fold hydrolase [Rhodospirillales bacterium]